MPNLKFYKSGTQPSSADIGAVLFNSTTNAVEVKMEDGWKSFLGPVVTTGDGTKVLNDKGEYTSITNFQMETLAYGIKWNEDDNAPVCTRIGNLELHKTTPIQSAFKGCVVDSNGNVNYYLDASDWSKKEDGTNSVLDGTDGNVMVDTGNDFYMKFVPSDTSPEAWCSLYQIDSTWIKVPRMFISAYGLSVDSSTSKAYSCCNETDSFKGGNSTYTPEDTTNVARNMLGKPKSNISRANMRKCARANGMELLCYEYYKYIFYWLYVIEYANFNCQATFNSNLTSEGYRQGGLGSGITNIANWSQLNSYNPICKCGYTNDIGNGTGVKSLVIPEFTLSSGSTQAQQTTYPCRWHGIENPFGDFWINLEGIYIYQKEVDGDRRVYSTSNPNYFDETSSGKIYIGNECVSNGYVKKIIFENRGEIIPISISSANSKSKFDYHYVDNKANISRIFLVGGYAVHGLFAGLGFLNSCCAPGGAYSHVGFFGCIIPNENSSNNDLSWKLYE